MSEKSYLNEDGSFKQGAAIPVTKEALQDALVRIATVERDLDLAKTKIGLDDKITGEALKKAGEHIQELRRNIDITVKERDALEKRLAFEAYSIRTANLAAEAWETTANDQMERADKLQSEVERARIDLTVYRALMRGIIRERGEE